MDKAQKILNSLTIEEKIRLLNGKGSWYNYDASGKLPVICMSDGPHGLRHQTEQENYADINHSRIATCFPTGSAIAASWNVDALYKMGSSIAAEAQADEVQIILGCGMNIKRSPLCGRNFEYYSEDPLLTGELSAAYIQGAQEKGVGTCPKHFALNNQEKFRQSSSSNADERTMREIYLAGFERAVKKAQPVSIMCSYNMINGTYASANKKLLTDILRKDWGFKGIVISDWGADIDAPKSLKAGLDLAMPDSNGYLYNQLKEAYNKGQITQEEIDTACKRIINTVLTLDEKKAKASVDFKAQHNTAFELACESAVLLKNDGFLPLTPGSTRQKLLVVGELAEKMHFQGGGSSHITTAEYPSALDCLKKDFDVIYVPGTNKKRLQKDVKIINQTVAQQPDIKVLYFCGLEESYEGEGFDRTDMQLPVSHLELYKELSAITKNIGLVTFSGSPIDLTFANEAHAILHMYLCGEASGEACHALITGLKNPSGKLAETWPLKIIRGLPVNDYDVNYDEGTLVGYRWYETASLPVQYEFGYGLSYTSFEYSNLNVQGSKVSLTIKNTGNYDGFETVQIYVKNPLPSPDSGISRSAIELRAFKKVFLKAGEEKEIFLELDDRTFCIYSTKKNCFAVVQGKYEICAASSVRNIKLSTSVTIKGEKITDLVLSDKEEQAKAFIKHPRHKKGEFTITDSLVEMAQHSLYVKCMLALFELVIILSSASKNPQDPAVKISICCVRENPLESLVSISNGHISKKLAERMVKSANR